MDYDLACSLAQAKRGDESHKAQAMISMQVTEKDMPYTAHGHAIAGEADLHTLAAIHHEEIAPEIDNLGRRRMTKRRLRASAAQNSNLETVQNL
jgi:hypothetical protein